MRDWSLTSLFSSLHNKIDNELGIAREAIKHPGTMGAVSEEVWLALLRQYLPKRYAVTSAHVVDSEGNFSDQIDVVVYDRQYSLSLFDFLGANVVPAESVYAVFEAKQEINAANIAYAKDKVASVRRLTRTSVQIPTASGHVAAVPVGHIVGGILTLASGWSSGLGDPLRDALNADLDDVTRLDLGCVSAVGTFQYQESDGTYDVKLSSSASIRFLLELVKRLQQL